VIGPGGAEAQTPPPTRPPTRLCRAALPRAQRRPAGRAQAVHSGADLQSAAASVLGYRQAPVKGRGPALEVQPVRGVASGRLRALLAAVLAPPGARAAPRRPAAVPLSKACRSAAGGTEIGLGH